MGLAIVSTKVPTTHLVSSTAHHGPVIDSSCYTVVFKSTEEYPSSAELRAGLEKKAQMTSKSTRWARSSHRLSM